MIFSFTRLGDLLFERGAVHVEWDFSDDEMLAVALDLLQSHAPAQFQAAPPGLKIIFDALQHRK